VEPVSIAALGVVGLATTYAFVRKALLSLVYAVTILAVYALQVISAPLGFASFSPVALELGLLVFPASPPPTWSWITFEFVHGSQLHVVLNLLGLILISPTFEERVGSTRWALLFFAGGAFGALVFVLVHLGEAVLLVGASGGIFGVFGAYGRLYPRDRVALFLPLPGLRPMPVIQVVVLFLALEMVLGVVLPGGIAWEGHAGALLFGFAAAPAIMRLPLSGRRVPRLESLTGWKDLATTPDLRQILDEVERADLAETREAWVEKFVAATRCPQCGGPLRFRFGRLTSACGWRRSA
jgi:membrane associated rhomboid family serine protease